MEHTNDHKETDDDDDDDQQDRVMRMIKQLICQEVGLILDLRSASERDDRKTQLWMEQLPPERPMMIIETDQEYPKQSNADNNDKTDSASQRYLVRIDVLSPSRFMTYIEQHWLTPAEQAQAALYKLLDGAKLHELRIDSLNAKGLEGLNEAIFETSKAELCRALQTITLHLETNNHDSVIIHCVQGKDR